MEADWPFDTIAPKQFWAIWSVANVKEEWFLEQVEALRKCNLIITSSSDMVEKFVTGAYDRQPRLLPVYDRRSRTMWFTERNHIDVRTILYCIATDTAPDTVEFADDKFIKDNHGWSMSSVRSKGFSGFQIGEEYSLPQSGPEYEIYRLMR